MKIGAGNATINFGSELLNIEGFKGIHDLPKLSVLVLEQNDVKFAIVSVEIVMLWDDFLKRMRTAVANVVDTSNENVWIHMTHAITTPHAPGGPLIGIGGEEIKLSKEEQERRDKELSKRKLYEDTIFFALIDALKGACHLKEAKMLVGTSKCSIVKNRDIKTKNGWWIGNGDNGEVNDEMTVISFKDSVGNYLCHMVCFGMKPCVIDNSEMDTGNRLISADAPGMMCRKLEEKYSCPVLYITGAAGDIVPEKTAWFDKENETGEIETVDLGVKNGIEFAEEIAEKMVEAFDESVEVALENKCDSMKISKTSYTWQTKGRIPMHPYKELTFEPEGTKDVSVGTLVLGNVAIVAGKPEINVITGKQLSGGSKYKYTVYASMINGGMKYMPDKKSYNELHWEALSSMLMPGAAEKFVETALEILN
ncbi:MAG: hypothetical protein E7273_02405 [Pseudobutyrivibrio ruminis]|nr:hypothetical protein [Pseudobutyrivibrio ruminis]